MLVAPAAAVMLLAARPTVRPVSMQPLVVAVAHFRPHERVRVSVSPPGMTRRVVVRRDGTFSVTFPSVVVDRCAGLSLSATGGLGDRAEWALKLPKTGCLPAP